MNLRPASEQACRPHRVRQIRRACRIVGALCLGLAAVIVAGPGARAANPPGSGFLSFSLLASAPGSQFTYNYPGAEPSPQIEGEVPQSLAQLQSGPQGYALSSVAWPGPLAANAGSTSQLLNLGLPSSVANNLNDPVRAEARTGSGPPTVRNDAYPGAVMTATATDTDVTTDATIAGANGLAPKSGSGNTETSSLARLTGPATAVATAESVVHDISLAGGLVTIHAVTSSATATTDARKATASGTTVVSGLEIGGQPAYIDQQGLHLGQGGHDTPVNELASAIANQALQSFGMKIAISQPTSKLEGALVTYDAGNVVFYWAVPDDPHGDTFTATFGGASVTVGASPALALSAPGLASGVLTAPAPSVGGPGPGTGTGGATPLPGGASVGELPTAVSPTALPPAQRSAAQRSAALPGGLSPLLLILVMLGSALIAEGLRRLPDQVLEPPCATCPLGGQP